MGAHMKTTIDVSDALMARAKQVAQQRQTTLRQLVEEGLRQVLDQHQSLAVRFALRDASVGGGQVLMEPERWRDLVNEPRQTPGAS